MKVYFDFLLNILNSVFILNEVHSLWLKMADGRPSFSKLSICSAHFSSLRLLY